MKFQFKNWSLPTPKKVKQIADTILGITALASTYSIIMDHPQIAAIVATVGAFAKLLSNFFGIIPSSEDETATP